MRDRSGIEWIDDVVLPDAGRAEPGGRRAARHRDGGVRSGRSSFNAAAATPSCFSFKTSKGGARRRSRASFGSTGAASAPAADYVGPRSRRRFWRPWTARLRRSPAARRPVPDVRRAVQRATRSTTSWRRSSRSRGPSSCADRRRSRRPGGAPGEHAAAAGPADAAPSRRSGRHRAAQQLAAVPARRATARPQPASRRRPRSAARAPASRFANGTRPRSAVHLRDRRRAARRRSSGPHAVAGPAAARERREPEAARAPGRQQARSAASAASTSGCCCSRCRTRSSRRRGRRQVDLAKLAELLQQAGLAAAPAHGRSRDDAEHRGGRLAADPALSDSRDRHLRHRPAGRVERHGARCCSRRGRRSS